jgi:hypothetical protein
MRACSANETGNDRANRSRAVVEADFTIGAMATTLSEIYATVHQDAREFAATMGDLL